MEANILGPPPLPLTDKVPIQFILQLYCVRQSLLQNSNNNKIVINANRVKSMPIAEEHLSLCRFDSFADINWIVMY